MGPLSEDQEEVHAEPALTQSALSDTPIEQTHPPDSPQVTPLESSEDAAALQSTTVKEDTESSIPARVENLASLTPHSGGQGSSADQSASQHLIDAESFSDSYTHVRPSPLLASIPGTLEEEEEEGLSPGAVKGELRKTLREDCEPEDEPNEGVGLRRRNISVLTPLYDRDEEEEAEEEQFRHPQRAGEGDIGFTLNKCIFGALVLLGLGTLFFSEGDVDAKDLKYSGTEKDWLNPDAQPGGVQPPGILDKLAEENQVAGLQAQLQKQELELKAVQLQAEVGAKERLLREELQAENQRMRGELDKLPVLQKEVEQENERVKRESERLNKELEALPAMQKELEHLKDKVMELSQSTVSMRTGTPSDGQDVPGHQERKEKDKVQNKEKDVRTENKERKKEKRTKGDEQHGREKNTKVQKEWEKEKDKQGRRKGEGKNGQDEHKEEDGQRWKVDSEKREFKEKSGKREWKGDKKWETEQPGEFVDREGKEDKEWRHKSEQKAWKKDEEWKKDKQASQKSKEWTEKSEKKDRKRRKELGVENESGASGEEKHSEGIQKKSTRKGKKDDHDAHSGPKERWEKHRSGKDKEKPKSGQRTEEWREEKKYKGTNRNKEDKVSRRGKHEASHHSHSDRKHSNDHVHINYWDKQREKIRHYYGSTEGCADVTACAHAEGLAPVSQQDFEAFISGYLTKLQVHGDQTRKGEVRKLVGEFFADGVFIHDQIPFSEFVEDIEDILEDLADGDDNDDGELMNGFAIQAKAKFVLQEKVKNDEKRGGSGRKRMKG